MPLITYLALYTAMRLALCWGQRKEMPRVVADRRFFWRQKLWHCTKDLRLCTEDIPYPFSSMWFSFIRGKYAWLSCSNIYK